MTGEKGQSQEQGPGNTNKSSAVATPGIASALGQSNRERPRDSLAFSKMQGLGNDFIMVAEKDLLASRIGAGIVRNWNKESSRLARALCNRHFGIGADGLIIVRGSDREDCQLGWSYINNDGSSSDMCGNGLRCVALWALDRELVPGNKFAVSTAKGPVPVVFKDLDHITVDLGAPILESKRIPVSGPKRETVVKESIEVGDKKLIVTCVSMGNPHCVIFDPGLNPLQYDVFAPQIQSLSYFPEGVNIEFVRTENSQCARVFVWERGCGPTLACASGAAAVAVAGVLEGRLDRKARIDLPGGSLEAEWSAEDSHVRITGPARETYRGNIDLAYILAEADQR